MDHYHFDSYPLTEQILDRYETQFLGPAGDSTPTRRAKSIDDMRYHLWTLWEAMATHRPALFIAYMHWVKTTLTSYGLNPDDIVASVETMRRLLDESLPSPSAATARQYLDSALRQLALPGSSAEPKSDLSPDAPLADLAQQVLRALLHGNRQLAIRLIQTEALAKKNVKDIYLYVLQPIQREIGRLWQLQQISVAMEHYCSETSQLIMSQLYPLFLGAPPHGHVLVATSVSGELHGIGMRMVADFFEMAGWECFYLGANTPTGSIIQTVIERRADVLGISATMTFNLGSVRDLIAAVRSTATIADTKILVGGGPFNLVPDLWQEIGADGYGRDAVEAVRSAGHLVRNQ